MIQRLPDEQLLPAAHAAVRGWLIPFASRILVIAPQQNCGPHGVHHPGSNELAPRSECLQTHTGSRYKVAAMLSMLLVRAATTAVGFIVIRGTSPRHQHAKPHAA